MDALVSASRTALEAMVATKKAFGAPGDYGYGTPQGDALFALARAILQLDMALSAEPSEADELAGNIAYALTKRLVIDMPTARAAVDEARATIAKAHDLSVPAA